MRVLVTGDRGYIGSIMVPVLEAAGHEVTGLDSDWFEDCLQGPRPKGATRHLRRDLRDVTAADLAGFDAVVHYGALCNDPMGDLHPEWTDAINHEASLELARLARAEGVQRFVYASSCSMYGASSSDELLTEEGKLTPLTAYAVSKVAAERDIAGLASDSFSPIYMRNATAYGWSPRLRADIVLNNLACWGYLTGKIRILSDGTPWRPLVHVEDICRAAAALLAAPIDVVHDQAFNIGSNDENYQVKDLAAVVKEELPECSVEYAGEAGPDPRNYRVDFSKLSRALPGFRTKWNARAGAAELVAQFRAHGLTRDDFDRRFTRLARLRDLLGSGRLVADLRAPAGGGR